MMLSSSSRENLKPGRRQIYYWKCDRPAAFHGTQPQRDRAKIEPALLRILQQEFPGDEILLRHGHGQGNHLTWIAKIAERDYFIRVENGPEHDPQLEVESHIMECVREWGVPTPVVHRVDAQRTRVPFAWQLMDLVPGRDLNEECKQGRLTPGAVAGEIGAAIARWQSVPVENFGHFNPAVLRQQRLLCGYHARYADYFYLNWERHLDYLVQCAFLSSVERQAIRDAVAGVEDLFALPSGCLVHKDLAFWNILGSKQGIRAFIDWDDAIAGDAMDDLSLLGCFHEGAVVARALDGYRAVRDLPTNYRERFWLHLLRNMIVKSVIRVGAGYFERTDNFFLLGSGMTGADLVSHTRSRIFRAVEGLASTANVEGL